MAVSTACAPEPRMTTFSPTLPPSTSSIGMTFVAPTELRPLLARLPPTARITASGASLSMSSFVTSVFSTTSTPFSSH